MVYQAPVRVLLAGVPAAQREAIREALADIDRYVVDTADSVTSAPALAATAEVVLVGVDADDSSGRLARQLAAAGEVPVMAVVDSAAVESGSEAIRSGCSDLLAMDMATAPGIRRAVDHLTELRQLRRERSRLEAQLAESHAGPLTDPDTGLPNRAIFMDRLERAVARRRRGEERELAVLYLDVDRFENVNESLGHRLGDELLLALARRLKGELRAEDSLARMGGDEFAILLDGIDELSAPTAVAERILGSLGAPFEIADTEVFMSVSIGIAVARSAEDPQGLLRDADTAMHKAKKQGPGGYRLFNEGMHDRAVALLELETDLRRALERNEFVTHYQPVVDLVEHRILGFEALVRWMHPDRGLVPPDGFLRAAEDTGLIVDLGAHVLRTALRQLREWRELDEEYEDIFMSVNLSPRQFADPSLVDTIRAVLEETGVPGELLRLELTESVVITDPEAVADSLAEIQELGVTLCIDDFGTGYSALNYLHSFPIDVIKIDRSFISRIREDGEGDLVETIIALARKLGMTAVAEGVETELQLDRLRKLGSTAVQGFLFSTPLDAPAAGEYLRTRSSGTPTGR